MDKKAAARHSAHIYRQSAAGKRANTLAKWKFRGLREQYPITIYNNHMAKTHCGKCKIKFGQRGVSGDRFKVMHHNHHTGRYVDTICNKCNKELARTLKNNTQRGTVITPRGEKLAPRAAAAANDLY